MRRGFAVALALAAAAIALGAGNCGVFAQQLMMPVPTQQMPAPAQQAPAQQLPAPAQCNLFEDLTQATKKKADAVQAAMKAKADRKEICALMTSFVTSEAIVVKFLEDNETWCGVPDQMVTVSKANHEKSLKFRAAACADDAPHVKPPSLSDAIKTAPVDSSANTKTGRYGTFNSLTGNPLDNNSK